MMQPNPIQSDMEVFSLLKKMEYIMNMTVEKPTMRGKAIPARFNAAKRSYALYVKT